MASAIKQTAFRFTLEDLAFLEAIQKHTGVRTLTDTLRAVIREYARSQGIKPKQARRA